MVLSANKNPKLYYSIREVAQKFDISESTLRYWEKEFPQLKPKTSNQNKIRQYTEKDIEQIRLIHNLVKIRGFKIAAARKMLNENRQGVDKSSEVLDNLLAVKEQLLDLKRRLDGLV